MNEVKIIVTAENRTFQEFERVRKHIKGIQDDFDKLGESLPKKIKKTGQGAGDEFKKGFSFSLKAFSDAPFELKAAGAAIGVALGVQAASAAAAVLSGGVLAGAAIAGVAGGLKLAATAPEVQDAAASIGETVSTHLKTMAIEVGFATAAVDSLDALGAAWGRNSVLVRDALAASVRYVEPLTAGIVAFGESVLPAVTRAIQRAEPVIRVVSAGIAQTGKAVGGMLDDITEHADEAAAAMQMVFDIISVTTIGLGKAVNKGTEFYGTMLDIGSALSGAQEDWIGWIPIAGDYMRETNNEFERLRDISDGNTEGLQAFAQGIKGTAGEMRDLERATHEAKAEVAKLNQEFSDAFDIMMDVETANINVKLGFIELKKELQQNKTDIADVTERNLRNRDAINDQVGALERQRQAAIDSGEGSKAATDAANAAYVAGIEALRSMLRQLKLLTPEMNTLLDQWIQLAKPKTIPVTVRINVVENGQLTRARGLTAQAAGGLTPTFGAASGMMLGGGTLTEVGEYGRELVRLPPGTQVYNNGTSNRIASSLGGGGPWSGASNTVRIEVSPAPGFSSSYTDEVLKQLRFRVRTEAGGDVNSYFTAY